MLEIETMKKIKNIPYGVGDFESVQLENDYYVDKTMFIPQVEKTRFNLLIRPRRFGKTLFLSMLETYYDINKKDRFEEFYHDTWILENPTGYKNSYLILYFNFSVVNPDINEVEDSFNHYCDLQINYFLDKYSEFMDIELTRGSTK